MRCLWLLFLVPVVCVARVVQIDDLVKQDKTYPIGTVIHETSGHIMQRDRLVPSERYRVEAIFRYCFAGVVKEGAKQYLKITVHNLLLENLVAANRATRSSSKSGPLRSDSIAQAKEIELLVPMMKGHAVYPFPIRVITPSTEERVEVMETVLEVRKAGLTVIEVAQKIYPAVKLPWLPPREWPKDTQTIYLGPKPEDEYGDSNGAAQPR